jgi:hypothetical protein
MLSKSLPKGGDFFFVEVLLKNTYSKILVLNFKIMLKKPQSQFLKYRLKYKNNLLNIK